MQSCTHDAHHDDVPHHQEQYQDKNRFLWPRARVPEATATVADPLGPADVKVRGWRGWILHLLTQVTDAAATATNPALCVLVYRIVELLVDIVIWHASG